MKLLATIGTGKYEETTYVFEGRGHLTRYCPVAMSRFLCPSEVLLIMTKEAHDKHYEALEGELRQLGVQVRDVRIPVGATEGEMWRIFQQIADNVEPEDVVTFDITHAFRHLPLLCFLAGFYLCFAKDITLKGIYYGAYESRSGGDTPVIDLSPFEQLIHWITACFLFKQSGSAKLLGDLLQGIHDMVRRDGLGEPTELKGLGRSLGSLSSNIMAARVPQVVGEAEQLATLASASGSRERLGAEVSAWAVPFVTIFDKTLESFAELAPIPGERRWRTYLRMVRWYRDHGHYHLAGQLLREVMVSAVVEVNRGSSLILDRPTREWAEDWLNKQAKSMEAEIGKAWVRVRDCRNDLGHMGFRENPKPVDVVVRIIDEEYRRLSQLDDGAWQVTP